jgi:hypothetical protein
MHIYGCTSTTTATTTNHTTVANTTTTAYASTATGIISISLLLQSDIIKMKRI